MKQKILTNVFLMCLFISMINLFNIPNVLSSISRASLFKILNDLMMGYKYTKQTKPSYALQVHGPHSLRLVKTQEIQVHSTC